MAPGWEMGMEFGMEFEGPVSASSAPSTITAASPAYMYGIPSVDTLRIDDLLDFSNVEHFPSSAAGGADTHLVAPPPDPYPAASRSRSFIADESSDGLHHPHLSTTTTTFSDNLYIPCEEAAELEWLSQFVEDSFSNVPYPSATESHIVTPSADAHLQTDPTSVPGRGARSKRSRASAPNSAHHLVTTWSSLAPPPTHSSSSSTTSSSSSSSSSDFPTQKPSSSTNSNSRKKGGGGEVGGGIGVEGGVRRCTHCASEKTPQWRTGPLGPKTLCNACGVRFKSGRLVPEYRPAASPTFVLTQHSNSHRKVMELRRQKDMVVLRHDGHPTSSSAAAAARPDILFHDYEVC